MPFKPSKLHSYIFRFPEEPDEILLLDTGVNQENTIAELESGLQNIDSRLSIESIAWIIPSHAHIDHLGALNLIKEYSDAKILMHQEEFNYFTNERPIHWMRESFRNYGIPDQDLDTFEFYLNYYNDYLRPFKPDITFTGGEGQLPLKHSINFVKISGHTPHHIALIPDPVKKKIFTGDTLLARISPNLGFSGTTADPVKEYLNTMDYLSTQFSDWIAYPAHQEIIKNISQRAMILKFLLEERLHTVKTFFEREKTKLSDLVKVLYPGIWDDQINRFLALMETHSYVKYFYGSSIPFTELQTSWE